MRHPYLIFCCAMLALAFSANFIVPSESIERPSKVMVVLEPDEMTHIGPASLDSLDARIGYVKLDEAIVPYFDTVTWIARAEGGNVVYERENGDLINQSAAKLSVTYQPLLPERPVRP